MCGIIGYVGHRAAAPIIMGALRRLEYRGYDSSGIALATRTKVSVHKAAGKLSRLENTLPARLPGRIGIGHTRWATHGAPTDLNAHPHLAGEGRLAVVHNGIIENASELRKRLEADGINFISETDTEVLAHLIASATGDSLAEQVRVALAQVHGTYGIVVLSLAEPDELVTARNGSPVILGVGEREMFVASDISALVGHTSQVVHLDDGEIATLSSRGFETITLDNTPRAKAPTEVSWTDEAYDLGDHGHYMQKEILDQPEAIARTLSGRLDSRFNTSHLGGLDLDARTLLGVRRVKFLGCGSAYYAGLTGAHMVETLARLPADAEPAAEFRYRNPVIEADCLYVAISQSGETLDTLMAVQEIRRRGGRVLGIVNVVGSTIAREVDSGIYIHAGPEVSVASTKAYTCSVTALALLALHLGRIRDLSPQAGAEIVEALQKLPEQAAEILADDASIDAAASMLAGSTNAFYIGRGISFTTALEGAQKLKEISYVHAEAYPSSELKHGPLALVTPDVPTVVSIPQDNLISKALAAVHEIRTRGGPIIAVTNPGQTDVQQLADVTLHVPATKSILNPILAGIALQQLAYATALKLGRDIDQPRNLAKSVTVE
jgi:glucosamine--fructose-6-phosphate aminotransferase (isomerizing)